MRELAALHAVRRAERAQEEAALRQRAERACAAVRASVRDTVASDVLRSGACQEAVDAEALALRQQLKLFLRQTRYWLDMYGDFQAAVEDLGDVEAWARGISADIASLERAVQYSESVFRRE